MNVNKPIDDRDDDNDALDARIAELSEYRGKETALWKDALEQHDAEGAAGPIARVLAWSVPRKALAAAAVLAVACGAYVAFMNIRTASVEDRFGARDTQFYEAPDVTQSDMASEDLRNFGEAHPTFPGGGGGFSGELSSSSPQAGSDQMPSRDDVAQALDGFNRAVIRKATIHLRTDDVRAAYLHAMHLISEARGEFIEASSLEGAGEHAQASITMRIDVSRMDTVLNQLRELGVVAHEQKHGDDVTGQMIDLEARLRNEERIEQELLELLDARDDAPLSDVLELRNEIAAIRSRVERLRAQQAHLSKLVDLATILIIIRHDTDAEDEPDDDGDALGDYFSRNIADAWRGGMRFLADTLGFLVQIIVGGAVWWVIAIGCIIAARHFRAKSERVMG